MKNYTQTKIIFASHPFDVSQIPLASDSMYLYAGQNLSAIINNLREHTHLFTKGGVQSWRIEVVKTQSQEKEYKARSKTSGEFYFHTDQSFSTFPPTDIVLYCEHPDKQGGGVTQLIPLDLVLERLRENDIAMLKQKIYEFEIPKEFQTSYRQEYTEKNLPILFYDQNGQLLIRYRFEKILKQGLPEQNVKALENLEQIIRTTTPFSYSMKEGDCLYINNGKFLHARTEIKDKNRLLHRVMFNRNRKIQGEIFHICQPIDRTQKLTKSLFNSFKQQFTVDLPFSQEVLHCDMIEFSEQFSAINNLKTSLYNFFGAVTKIFGQDSNMGLHVRQTLGWPERISNILIQLNQRKPFYPQFYRPDFILTQNGTSSKYQLKICEINCRFATNAFIMSLILNEIVCNKKGIQYDQPHHSSIAKVVLNEFEKDQDIYFITSLPRLWDPLLLSDFLQQTNGKPITFIRPDQLTAQNSELIHTSTSKRIANVILELSQEQIIALPQEVLQALAFQTKCINDLRSIFICHDKRLLGLIHEQDFYQVVRMKYLQNSEMDYLKENTIQTWNKQGAGKIEKLIQNRAQYILKSPHKGKSKGMIFGCEVTEEQWCHQIENRESFVIQKFTKPLQLPIWDLKNQKQLSICSTVGTFLCFQNQCWGMGMYRCGQGRCVCLSSDSFFLGTRIFRSQKQQQLYYNTQNIKYTKAQIRQKAKKKYKNLTYDQNNDFKMFKQDIRGMDIDWKSKYISSSGGSSNRKLYVGNGISENHYMRRELAKMIRKNRIITEDNKCLIIFTGKNIYRTRQIFVELLQYCQATSIPVSQFVLEEVLEYMEKFKVDVIIGIPSISFILAKHFANNPQKQITRFIYGGQFLYQYQKKVFKQAFPNVEIYNVFGSAQTGVWAYGYGGLSEYNVYKYLSEIIEIQIQNPDQEGVGKLLITNKIRDETPVYRFQMGDYGQLINSETFRLVARPQIKFFKMLGCCFEVEQIHQITRQTLNWQVILKNCPQNTIQLSILLKEQTKRHLYKQIQDKYSQQMKKLIQTQQARDKINLKCIIIENQKQMIKAIPSFKHYYIIDQR